MEESAPSSPNPILSSIPIPSPYPSFATSKTQSSVLECSPETSCVDNDISDLLLDSFGIVPRINDTKVEDKFIEELDQNLPMLAEIFDDLQNVVKSENITVKEEIKFPNEGEKLKMDPTTTINDIEKEIEYEIELDRVERLRKPKFQTMPAYEKRAKQETQWRAAVRAAKRASSLHCSAPYKLPAKFSGGSSSNLHTVVLPILTKDPVETSSSLDLSSLDPVSSSLSSSSHLPSQPVDIVQSSLMVNTKKHLSAANHFPANSRLFNRSLKQLQSQADAISSAYLQAAEARTAQQKKAQVQTSSNVLKKTTNITRFLKDINSNQVPSSISASGSQNEEVSTTERNHVPVSNNVAQCTRSNIVHTFDSVQAFHNNFVFTRFNNNVKPFNNNDVQSFKNVGPAVQASTYKNNAVQTKNKDVLTFKNIAVNTFNNSVVKIINNKVVQTVNNISNAAKIPVVKAPHLPVYSLPTNQVRTPQVLHPPKVIRSAAPATYPAQQPTVPQYFLVDVNSSATSVIQKVTPLIHPKSKVSQSAAITRSKPLKKAVPLIPSSPSCHNCQKLAGVLPYLAHSRRKLGMHSRSGVPEAPMVLVCEICGEAVRETVIFADHIVLDHVSTDHFPSFLVNSQDQDERQEESQNYVRMGEKWGY